MSWFRCMYVVWFDHITFYKAKPSTRSVTDDRACGRHRVCHTAPVECTRPCSCHFPPERSVLTDTTSIRVETNPGCLQGYRDTLIELFRRWYENSFRRGPHFWLTFLDIQNRYRWSLCKDSSCHSLIMSRSSHTHWGNVWLHEAFPAQRQSAHPVWCCRPP